MPSLHQLRPIVSMIIVLTFLISTIPAGATLAPSGQGANNEQVFSTKTLTAVPDAGKFTLERAFQYPFPQIVHNDQLGTEDISIAGLPSTGVPGTPSVPVEHVTVAMAPGLRAVSVEAIDDDPVSLELDGPITPSAEEISVCGGTGAQNAGNIIFGPVYSVAGLHPSATSSFSESFGLTDPAGAGQTRNNILLTGSVRSHYIDIELYPVQYNPVTGLVVIHSSLTLKVQYAKDPTYVVPLSGLRAPTYDNMIVTPLAYVPTFQVLSDHHNATGVKTTVVAIEDVYSGKYFPSSGVDNAEKLKVFIKNATDAWGLTYVTLGGDSALIPARHAWVAWDFATDLYFADIYLGDGSFASWDANSDGKWGNWTDDKSKMDLRPDLHIGRLPAATLAQAAGMVAKIRNYDNTTGGDKFFRNVTFLSGIGAGDGVGYSNWLIDNVYPAKDGWYHNKLYNAAATAENLSIPQNNSVGFMVFWGHGGTDSWLGGASISTADIYALTNFDELPIVSIMACDCGNFEAGTDGFAETFLKNTQGGAIGVLAGTQTSNANDMDTWAGATNKYFHAANAEHRIRRLGAMFSAGVNMFLDNKNWKTQSLDYKNLLEYVMFGDPAATIGGYSRTTAQITTDNGTKFGLPGQNVTFNVSIENTGTGWADFNVTFKDPAPSPWAASLPFNFTNIIAGDNKTFQVNVTIPQDALAGSSLILTVVANSTNIPVSPLTVLLRTVVDVNYTFTFVVVKDEKTVAPGTTAQYQFVLENTGNGEFPFLIEPVLPSDTWNYSSFGSEKYLSPGESCSTVLSMTPGPFVEWGRYEQVFSAHIVSDPTGFKYVWVNTTVDLQFGFDLVPNRTVANIENGWARFNITIINTGNYEEMVDIMIMSAPLGGGWTVLADKSSLILPAFSSGWFQVDASKPYYCIAGTYNTTFRVKNHQDFNNYYKEVNLTMTVKPVYDFWLDLMSYNSQVWPSSTFSFDAMMTNNGNSLETFDITVTGLPLYWSADHPGNISILPGNQQLVTIGITIGTDDLMQGSYNLTVTITSRASGISENKTFEAWVERTYALYIYCDVPAIEADPGETAKLALHVENQGNGPEVYVVKVGPLAFWYTDWAPNLTLEAFSNATVWVSASPSPYAGPVVSNLPLTVTSLIGPGTSMTVLVKTIVNKTYGLKVSEVNVQSEVYAGEDFPFTLMITNLGNGDDTFTTTVKLPSTSFILSTPVPTTLVGFQTKAKTFSVTVAKGTKSGTYTFPITVWSMGKSDLYQNVTFSIVVKKKTTPADPVKDMFMYLVAAVVGIIVIFVLMVVLMLKPKGRTPTASPKAPPPVDGPPVPNPPEPGKP